jgi:hypothetical protein
MRNRLYKIEKLSHCVRIVFERGAVISADDIIAALDHENELYPIEDRQTLWDFRGCQVTRDFGFDAMSRFVDSIRKKFGNATTTNRGALLVDGSTLYGLSRMFQLLMDGFPTQIGVFQDEDAAMNWIGGGDPSEEKGP